MKNFKSESRATRTPSSSSDEIIFISSDKRSHIQNNESADSYESLRFQKLVTCEFCEEVFLNRYDHIVHNASHIIIPLSKDNILRCRECLKQCESHRQLKKHMKKKHCKELLNDNNKEDNEELDMLDEKTVAKWESKIEILKSTIAKQESDILNLKSAIDRKEPIVISVESNRRCEIISSCKIEIECDDGSKIIEISDSDDDVVVKNGDLKSETVNNKVPNVKKRERLRDRFQFEEDILGPESPDDNGTSLIQDLTSECKINMDLEPPWRLLQLDGNSVHYEELVTSGKVKCRLCGKGFPNRYKAIIHETSHIELTKGRPYLCRYCDWYISDNLGHLNAHIRRKHKGFNQKKDPDDEKTKRKTQVVKCEKCNLNYVSHNQHTNNYHKALTNDKLLPAIKKEQVEQDGGEQYCGEQYGVYPYRFYTKIEKICELCCSFLKYETATLSEIVGEHCEVGNRLRCDKCGRESFELKLVKRRTKFRVSYNKHAPKKNVSNYDRLKNIQNRLKMMKNL